MGASRITPRPGPAHKDLESLAALLLERTGLKVTPSGFQGLKLALEARLAALGQDDAGAYVRDLRGPAAEAELRALVPLVTVGKTDFFRDARQFAALEDEVLPQVARVARAEDRPVRLWSAGCATGEEPYSLGMLALERGLGEGQVDVWATDLNPRAVEAGQAGIYPSRRLVPLSSARVERFFVRQSEQARVVDSLKALVRFETHNLAAPSWPSVAPQSLDVIFCRNVLIYFDPPTIAGVIERFSAALRPSGWLFLGYSESLFNVSTRLEMVEVGGTFLYRHAQTPAPRRRRPVAPPEPLVRELPGPRPPPPPARRPEPPSRPPSVRASGLRRVAAPPPALPDELLALAARRIDEGDFHAAEKVARQLVERAPDLVAARLTLGNVQSLLGSRHKARETLEGVVKLEPLCVEARLYLALLELEGGDLGESRRELTRALFLEPTLMVGHYLLGLVGERLGEAEAARRSYRNALALKTAPLHQLLGHFPDLPRDAGALAQAAQHRLAALSESEGGGRPRGLRGSRGPGSHQ